MDPFTIAAAAGSIINPIVQGVQNEKQRKWNEAMMNQQRQWSLQDWNRQNEYNSPLAQMQRLKAAGLNPHLMYGKGEVGNAQSIRPAESKAWNPTAPQVNTTPVMSAYYDSQLKEQQVDLLKKEQTLKTNQAMLQSLQAAQLTLKNRLSETQVKYADQLAQSSLEVMNQNARKLSTSTEVMLKDYELREAQTAANLSEAISRNLTRDIGRTKAQEEINNLRKTGILQNWEIELSKQGLTPKDAVWIRVFSEIVSAIKEDRPLPLPPAWQKANEDWRKNKPKGPYGIPVPSKMGGYFDKK